MSQMRLNFLNNFALALPRPAMLGFRSIPAVDARIVAIASISFGKFTRICHKRPPMEKVIPRPWGKHIQGGGVSDAQSSVATSYRAFHTFA